MKHNTEEIFLAQWLSGELSEADLADFKKSEDYLLYKRIAETSSNFNAPNYDLTHNFQQLQYKRALQTKTKTFSWLRYVASMAAVLVLSLLVYQNFFAPTTYATGFGEQLAVELPDGSSVQLNAQSRLTVQGNNWDKHRIIELEGEAFFDVEKGNTFTVQTPKGLVEVLGTEFTVNASHYLFEVNCFEGKVKVLSSTNQSPHYLTSQQGVRYINNTSTQLSHQEMAPTWLNYTSSFSAVPFKVVFEALQNQYNLNFDYTHFDDNQLFSGSFPNNNQSIALETVLKSVNLNYTLKGNTVVIEE